MSWNDWLQKAKTERPAPDETDMRLGGITDHHLSAYQMRCALEPMYGAELKAFNWVLKHLQPKYPSLGESDLIDEATSLGWFYCDEDGKLRVSKVTP